MGDAQEEEAAVIYHIAAFVLCGISSACWTIILRFSSQNTRWVRENWLLMVLLVFVAMWSTFFWVRYAIRA